MNDTIWLKKPARMWEEALPVGNGRLGGMIFGNPSEERIALNADELWSGSGREKLVTDAHSVLKEIGKLAKAGRYHEAEQVMWKSFLNEWNESYLPLGDLYYRFLGDGEITGYRRELDLSNGIAVCRFRKGGVGICSEVYCSKPAQVMVVKIFSERELNVEFRLDSVLRHHRNLDGHVLFMSGMAPSCVQPAYYECREPVRYDEEYPGMSFCAGIRVVAQGGETDGNEDRLVVRGTREILCYLTAETGYDMETGTILKSPAAVRNACDEKLRRTAGWLEEEVRKVHVRDFSRLFGRVTFNLGGRSPDLPTDQRLMRFEKDRSDTGLLELLFHYGRYLLISSSREGTMAANLQGIWNDKLRAPWSSNYTTNINLQMNYWMADKVNLPELRLPLFELLRHCVPNGEKTAREQFGCRGWAANHNIDCWYQTSPVGRLSKKPPVKYGYFPIASGWLCLDLWDHYLYTGDRSFLEQYYPVLKGSCIFYMDYLTEDGGYLLTAPSTSPENLFYDEDGNQCALSVGSTIDIAVIRMLFEAGCRAMKLLDTDQELCRTMREMAERLPGYRVGRDGGIQEWSSDFPQVYPEHRHISHLVGLYPGRDKALTEELYEPCRRTLENRTEEGTAWSKVWKSCLWARLGDGERAYEQLCRIPRAFRSTAVDYAESGCYDNLFCAPPLQIDGNLGFTAAVLEMLVQDGEGKLELLPAAPAVWERGKITGIRIMGGHLLDFSWEHGVVKTARLRGGADDRVLVKMNSIERLITVEKSKITYITLS